MANATNKDSEIIPLKVLALQAVEVQDASNLSGVVHTFDKVVSHLHSHSWHLKKGTAWVNRHPITQAFVDKLASLAGVQGITDAALDAHARCNRIAKGLDSGEEV